MITLLEWVEEQREEGIDDAEIGLQLTKQGYHPDDVAEALRAPFHVKDDPNLIQKLFIITFAVAIIGFIIMLIIRPIVEGSIWGLIFISAAGFALFHSKELWRTPKEVMAGLIVFMAIMVFGSGLAGIRFLGYFSIIILSPLAAYAGVMLLRVARARAEQFLALAIRPMVLLSILFVGLELFAVLVREGVLQAKLFEFLMPNAGFINIHAGFAIAVTLYCITYFYLYTQKFSLPKEHLMPYAYSILGYTIAAAVIELVALLV